MPARPRNVLWIVLLLGGAGSAFLLLRPGSSDNPLPEPVSARAEPAPEVTTMEGPVRPAPSSPSSERCSTQHINVMRDGPMEAVCVGATTSEQDGSIRTYRVESDGGAPRWLRIEAAGNLVLSAALGSGDRLELECREKECSGISIGRRDVQGVRVISLREVALTDSAKASARVSAQLRTAPEDHLFALSCGSQGVSISTSDSSSIAFCPRGGAGFEIGGDGRKSYRFLNLDGESLRVAVDEREEVQKIEFHGDTTLSCAAGGCVGARISGENAAGERTFTFAGTTLTEISKADTSAVLNGTLILPPL